MGKVVKINRKPIMVEISVRNQLAYDPDDGTGAGYYAWVGRGGQSDFCCGPYKTKKAAHEAGVRAAERNY